MSGPDLVQCGVCLRWVSAEHDHDCQGAAQPSVKPAPSAATVETPRTDALEYDTGLGDTSDDKDMVVRADDARDLERELNQSKASLASSQKRCAELENELAESIELAEGQIASEKLAGNVAKENYWWGELVALRRMRQALNRKAAP